MRTFLKPAFLAASALVFCAGNASADIITLDFTGTALNGTAEQQFPGVWGTDAYGNSIIGDTYTASFTFNTDLGTIGSDAAGSYYNLTETGLATGWFTIGGHTYEATGSSRAYYYRNTDYVEVSFSDDPKANSGVTLQALTDHTVVLDPHLNVNIPTLTLNPADVAQTGLVAVLLGDNGGVLRASLNVETLTVTAVPVPAALPMFLSALAGLGWFGQRRAKA